MLTKKLLYLSGLSILGVILFHTAGMGFVAMFAWAAQYASYVPAGYDPSGSLQYYLLRFLEQTVVLVIPCFLFISGYFVAFSIGRNKATISWGDVRNRIVGLLIPYLIWTTIAVALLVVAQGERPGLLDLLRYYLVGDANPVLYFIPLLLQFYALSPFLGAWAKKDWKSFLLVAAILQIIVNLLPYPYFLGWDNAAVNQFARWVPKWLFLARIFWFSFGIVIGLHFSAFKAWLARYRWVFLVVTLLAIPAGMIEWEIYTHTSGQAWLSHWETLIDTLYSLAFLLTLLAFENFPMPANKWITYLGGCTFGIYLTHAFVIEYTAKIIYRFVPALLANQFLFQPVLLLVGLAVPLAMIEFTRRTPFNRFYKFIFG